MPKLSKKAAAKALVQERNWQSVGREEWTELRAQFSENTSRTALAELGIPLSQPFAGIQTKSLEQLEESLLQMAQLYTQDPAARPQCRQQVILTKDRTRFASRNLKVSPEKRAAKEEMVEWMLVWLGDPAMFGAWAALRKRALYCSSTVST